MALDANLSTPDPQFGQFLSNYNLYDILRDCHGTPAATRIDGNCLDVIVGSRFVAENTLHFGTLSSVDGTLSDHTIGFIDLTSTLFHCNANRTTSISRGFTSKQH